MPRSLVVGFGVTGRAVVEALLGHGEEVIVVDDRVDESMTAIASALGITLVASPTTDELADLVAGCDAVLPSPGVPERHEIFAIAAATGVPVESEFDLASRWDSRPIVAITGTDGKTTVTTLVTEMLEASGIRAVACGNTDTPLVEAISDPDTEVFVVEASSFRLAVSNSFRPLVAVWLNFAPDHLDAHDSLASYESAKARIWARLDEENGLAVANAEDPVVLANRNPAVRTVTFGPPGSDADATIVDGDLCLPDGTHVIPVDELRRSFPHDISNALAAMVAAVAAGATLEGVRRALRSFGGLSHRVQAIGARDGVRWFDDSKATTPHAALTAIGAFESVVLIAGGRNKGLDLSVLGGSVPPVKAVIAIGDSAEEIEAAFEGRCPIVLVKTSMDDAVAAAAQMAVSGDVVLLSPGCTSFDWFGSYAERGDEFARACRMLPNFESEVAA